MTRLETSPPPAQPDDAYVGYRWPGRSATVRLPSGEHALLGADAAGSFALAKVVLSDRLGHVPCTDLLVAFTGDWVRPSDRGEFVWPIEAVDDWLAAGADGAPGGCSGPLDRALELTRGVLRAPLPHHPLSATTTQFRPPGGAL